MREDIKGILKNALERGATMEQASQSLVNSGYNNVEVKEAANQVSPGAISTISSKAPVRAPRVSPRRLPSQLMRKPLTQRPLARVKSKGMGKIILLAIILLILIGALIATIIFKDQIVNFLTNLF